MMQQPQNKALQTKLSTSSPGPFLFILGTRLEEVMISFSGLRVNGETLSSPEPTRMTVKQKKRTRVEEKVL